jgi:hypothetical protein
MAQARLIGRPLTERSARAWPWLCCPSDVLGLAARIMLRRQQRLVEIAAEQSDHQRNNVAKR